MVVPSFTVTSADFEDGGLEDALSELDESAADVDAGAVPATVYETAACSPQWPTPYCSARSARSCVSVVPAGGAWTSYTAMNGLPQTPITAQASFDPGVAHVTLENH